MYRSFLTRSSFPTVRLLSSPLCHQLRQRPAPASAPLPPSWSQLQSRSLFEMLRPAPRRLSLPELEAAASGSPHDASLQAAYLQALQAADPLTVVRHVESMSAQPSFAVMQEYQRAKQRLDSSHAPSAASAPLPPPQQQRHAFYPHYSQSQPHYPASPAYYSPSPFPYGSYASPASDGGDGRGSPNNPISVSIVSGLSPPMSGSSASSVSPAAAAASSRAARSSMRRPMMWLLVAFTAYSIAVWIGPQIAASAGSSIMSRAGFKEFKADGDVPKTLFQDVKGCDEAKAELEEIVAYLRNPQRFEKLGGKMVKGILLTGPPGTGKTLLAKAIAGEAHVPFFSSSGSDFEEMFVGVGARRIRELFATARKKAPCIIFIDEIDAVGSKRSSRDIQAARLSLNQLLVEMDGFDKANGVIVIGATNLPQALDPALTRPGRFDRHVTVPVPDVRGRKAILALYAKKIPLAADVNLEVLARGTPGCTGAQLFNLINSAALRASSKGMTAVTMKEMEYAKDKILMGAERVTVMSPEERRLTAYHEGGHTLVALYTRHSIPLYKATILPRGPSLGTTHFLPEDDMHTQTRAQLVARMDVAMGGRVAEQLVFGDEMVTTGASSDLEGATRIARAMVTQYGMGDGQGLMVVDGDSADALSSEHRAKIDSEIERCLRSSYERAAAIVRQHLTHLHTLADALLQHETLSAKEIRELLSRQGLIGQEEEAVLVRAEQKKPLVDRADILTGTETEKEGAAGRPHAEPARGGGVPSLTPVRQS